MESGLSARTVNRKITCLKTFYKYLMRQEAISKNPRDRVMSPKLNRKLPGFVEEEKRDTLLDD